MAYHLDIEKWQAIGTEDHDKWSYEEKWFNRNSSEMGLLLHKVKAGTETLNDGNTVQHFF
jgi:hypothetical protein